MWRFLNASNPTALVAAAQNDVEPRSNGANPYWLAAFDFSATQSGVEVVQDPKLSKDDRPLWVAVEAFDLARSAFRACNREQ